MATIVSTGFESGVNGNTLTGPTAGTDSVQIGGTSTLTFDTAQKVHGTVSAKVGHVDAAVFTIWQGSLSTARTDYYGEGYFYFTGYPSASNRIFRATSDASAATYALDLASTGTIIVRNSANTNVKQMTTVVPLNQWVRLEWHIVHGTSGTIQVWLYTSADGTTEAETTGVVTSNFGTNTWNAHYGVINNTPQVPVFWMDDIQLATTKIGPTGTPTLSASWSVSPLSGPAPLTVGAAVTVTGGVPPYTFAYNWGDGSTAGTTANESHIYTVQGSYSPTCDVTDSA